MRRCGFRSKLITTTYRHNFLKLVVKIYGTGGETSASVPASAPRLLDCFCARASRSAAGYCSVCSYPVHIIGLMYASLGTK